MVNYFSIGEMSKLHNISVQTLRYYDKIDLFQPAYTNESSNYRYYTSDQFVYLDIIKYLKYIGTSLDEIKHIINYQNSIDDLTEILMTKEKTIDDQIQRLSNLKGLIKQKITQLKQTSNINSFGDVYVKHFLEASAVMLDFNGTTQDDFILSIRKTMSKIEKKSYAPNSDLGFLSEYQEYSGTKTVHYKKMFLVVTPEISEAVKEGALAKIPAGDYLCILYRGFEKEAEECYKTLFDYIESNELQVSGYFYESSIIHGIATTNPIDYIMEVKILLKSS